MEELRTQIDALRKNRQIHKLCKMLEDIVHGDDKDIPYYIYKSLKQAYRDTNQLNKEVALVELKISRMDSGSPFISYFRGELERLNGEMAF